MIPQNFDIVFCDCTISDSGNCAITKTFIKNPDGFVIAQFFDLGFCDPQNFNCFFVIPQLLIEAQSHDFLHASWIWTDLKSTNLSFLYHVILEMDLKRAYCPAWSACVSGTFLRWR